MRVALHTPRPEGTARWIAALAEALPEAELCALNDLLAGGGSAPADYAVVWRPPPGALARLRGLRAIVSIGAGVDHVLADPALPPVPVLRTLGPDLTQRMREYVALHVLRHHRDMPALCAAQARAEWRQIVTPPAPRRRVGVMGLGVLGSAAAQTLVALGFDVAGLSREPREMAGIRCYPAGALPDFLARSEILVNLLPLTAQTRDLLDARRLAMLPRGACLVHAGRGEHLDEDALLDALDSGQIAQATLDVFRTEPLPADHPFWRHPQVTVTPHLASMIDPQSGAALIAESLRACARGALPAALADPQRGY